MATVETVRGRGGHRRARADLHARARLRSHSRRAAELPGRMGQRGRAGGRCRRQAQGPRCPRDPQHRRPHRCGPGTVHPPHSAHSRSGVRTEHHRGHRLLHLRPGAVLLLLPGPGPVGRAGHGGARPDGGDVRRRYHRRHLRHRGQGRLPQVRHRSPGHDRWGGSGDACRGQGPPPYRCPHHRAHPSGLPRRPGGEAAAVRRGGGRCDPGRAGSLRRQQRRRPPQHPGRPRLHPGYGPVRDQRGDDLRVSGRHAGRNVPPRLRGPHGPGP